MFDQKYKSLFHKIKGTEEHKEQTREKMQNEVDGMNKKNTSESRSFSFYKYAAVAASILVFSVAGFNLFGKNGGNGALVDGETPPSQGTSTVLYSTLNFSETTSPEAPIAIHGMEGRLAPFTEELLAESSVVLKGTVTKIWFKEYSDGEGEGNEESARGRQSVVYEIKIDKLYYAQGVFAVGESIVVENDLYTYTSLEGSVEKLSVNRQYILALVENREETTWQKREGSFSVLYPFTAQIEMTEDAQALFPDHWVSLINSSTKTVTMDVEGGRSYSGEMKLREDIEFEADFQKIVDAYCK